jgi:hypothetical protein
MVHLINPEEMVVQAYATEEQQDRLASGTEGWFYADDPAREARRGRVQDLRQVDESQFALAYLASLYSGPQAIRGMAHVQGESRSAVRQLWEHIGAVFIRESGM